jgi:hypothetical protein
MFSTSFSSLLNLVWSPFQTTNIVFHNFFWRNLCLVETVVHQMLKMISSTT